MEMILIILSALASSVIAYVLAKHKEWKSSKRQNILTLTHKLKHANKVVGGTYVLGGEEVSQEDIIECQKSMTELREQMRSMESFYLDDREQELIQEAEDLLTGLVRILEADGTRKVESVLKEYEEQFNVGSRRELRQEASSAVDDVERHYQRRMVGVIEKVRRRLSNSWQ